MITLSDTHAATRAAAALAATLSALNAGATGATISLYSTARPANGASAASAGGAAQAVLTLPNPAGTITDGVLTLSAVTDAMIASTGVVLWARVKANGVILFDCDVSDTAGSATIRLATTQLYAGGAVHLTSAILG